MDARWRSEVFSEDGIQKGWSLVTKLNVNLNILTFVFTIQTDCTYM